MTATWAPTRLPDDLMMRGGDPNLLGKELLGIIGEHIANQPRTLQKRIGPSEIGQKCPRRLGYKLLNAPEFNQNQGVAWKPFIGTCVHAELANVFDQHNLWFDAWVSTGDERWYVEHKVGSVGLIGDDEIDGSCDLYDRVTCSVIDWKIVGPSPLKEYKAKGPGPQYRSQAHLYGRGWQRHHGLPVDTVMIVFLPRNGELHDTYIWYEPYDEQVALDALTRVNGIKTTVDVVGINGLDLLLTADAYCYRCPYHVRGSTDLRNGCPGHAGTQSTPTPPITLEGRP